MKLALYFLLLTAMVILALGEQQPEQYHERVERDIIPLSPPLQPRPMKPPVYDRYKRGLQKPCIARLPPFDREEIAKFRPKRTIQPSSGGFYQRNMKRRLHPSIRF